MENYNEKHSDIHRFYKIIFSNFIYGYFYKNPEIQ